MLGHFTHYTKVARLVRLDVAFVWMDGNIQSRCQLAIVRVFVPDTMAATVSVTTRDCVVELLKTGFQAALGVCHAHIDHFLSP